MLGIIQFEEFPAWATMWSVAFAIDMALKIAVAIDAASVRWADGRALVFLITWPGMDKSTFLNSSRFAVIRPTIWEWTGHLFCAGVLICPCGLLFHSAFVARIIIPFLTAIGSRS